VNRGLKFIVLVVRKVLGHIAGNIRRLGVVFFLQGDIQFRFKGIGLHGVAGKNAFRVIFGQFERRGVRLERVRVVGVHGAQGSEVWFADVAGVQRALVQFDAVAPHSFKTFGLCPVSVAEGIIVYGIQIGRVWRQAQILFRIAALRKRIRVPFGLFGLVAQYGEHFRVLQVFCRKQGVGLLKPFLTLERLHKAKYHRS